MKDFQSCSCMFSLRYPVSQADSQFLSRYFAAVIDDIA
jgi:hypothetical protein